MTIKHQELKLDLPKIFNDAGSTQPVNPSTMDLLYWDEDKIQVKEQFSKMFDDSSEMFSGNQQEKAAQRKQLEDKISHLWDRENDKPLLQRKDQPLLERIGFFLFKEKILPYQKQALVEASQECDEGFRTQMRDILFPLESSFSIPNCLSKMVDDVRYQFTQVDGAKEKEKVGSGVLNPEQSVHLINYIWEKLAKKYEFKNEHHDKHIYSSIKEGKYSEANDALKNIFAEVFKFPSILSFIVSKIMALVDTRLEQDVKTKLAASELEDVSKLFNASNRDVGFLQRLTDFEGMDLSLKLSLRNTWMELFKQFLKFLLPPDTEDSKYLDRYHLYKVGPDDTIIGVNSSTLCSILLRVFQNKGYFSISDPEWSSSIIYNCQGVRFVLDTKKNQPVVIGSPVLWVDLENYEKLGFHRLCAEDPGLFRAVLRGGSAIPFVNSVSDIGEEDPSSSDLLGIFLQPGILSKLNDDEIISHFIGFMNNLEDGPFMAFLGLLRGGLAYLNPLFKVIIERHPPDMLARLFSKCDPERLDWMLKLEFFSRNTFFPPFEYMGNKNFFGEPSHVVKFLLGLNVSQEVFGLILERFYRLFSKILDCNGLLVIWNKLSVEGRKKFKKISGCQEQFNLISKIVDQNDLPVAIEAMGSSIEKLSHVGALAALISRLKLKDGQDIFSCLDGIGFDQCSLVFNTWCEAQEDYYRLYGRRIPFFGANIPGNIRDYFYEKQDSTLILRKLSPQLWLSEINKEPKTLIALLASADPRSATQVLDDQEFFAYIKERLPDFLVPLLAGGYLEPVMKLLSEIRSPINYTSIMYDVLRKLSSYDKSYVRRALCTLLRCFLTPIDDRFDLSWFVSALRDQSITRQCLVDVLGILFKKIQTKKKLLPNLCAILQGNNLIVELSYNQEGHSIINELLSHASQAESTIVANIEQQHLIRILYSAIDFGVNCDPAYKNFQKLAAAIAIKEGSCLRGFFSGYDKLEDMVVGLAKLWVHHDIDAKVFTLLLRSIFHDRHITTLLFGRIIQAICQEYKAISGKAGIGEATTICKFICCLPVGEIHYIEQALIGPEQPGLDRSWLGQILNGISTQDFSSLVDSFYQHQDMLAIFIRLWGIAHPEHVSPFIAWLDQRPYDGQWLPLLYLPSSTRWDLKFYHCLSVFLDHVGLPPLFTALNDVAPVTQNYIRANPEGVASLLLRVSSNKKLEKKEGLSAINRVNETAGFLLKSSNSVRQTAAIEIFQGWMKLNPDSFLEAFKKIIENVNVKGKSTKAITVLSALVNSIDFLNSGLWSKLEQPHKEDIFNRMTDKALMEWPQQALKSFPLVEWLDSRLINLLSQTKTDVVAGKKRKREEREAVKYQFDVNEIVGFFNALLEVHTQKLVEHFPMETLMDNQRGREVLSQILMKNPNLFGLPNAAGGDELDRVDNCKIHLTFDGLKTLLSESKELSGFKIGVQTLNQYYEEYLNKLKENEEKKTLALQGNSFVGSQPFRSNSGSSGQQSANLKRDFDGFLKGYDSGTSGSEPVPMR